MSRVIPGTSHHISYATYMYCEPGFRFRFTQRGPTLVRVKRMMLRYDTTLESMAATSPLFVNISRNPEGLKIHTNLVVHETHAKCEQYGTKSSNVLDAFTYYPSHIENNKQKNTL